MRTKSAACSTTICAPMRGMRRLSQAISEGDGISVIVEVDGPEAARAAEAAGAEAVVVNSELLDAVRPATSLPIIWRADPNEHADEGENADAYLIGGRGVEGSLVAEKYSTALGAGLECVVQVTTGEELEALLESVDPEIFLLVPGDSDGADAPLERVLDLLPDVPAGKLAIADIGARTREEVEELERAGIDGVIVGAVNVEQLVGAAPPEV